MNRGSGIRDRGSGIGERPALIRVMGRWSLTAAVVNGVIGSGIFGLPSAVAALVGVWSPVAVLVAGCLVFLILLCFAEVASRFDDAGGPYLYARQAFGPFIGFQVGWLLLGSRLLAGAATLNILADYLAPLVPAVGAPVGRMATMTCAIALVTAINVRGVRMAAWTTNAFTVAKLLPLLLLIVIGLPQLSAEVFATQVVSSPGWREAVLLMVFAYGGFESTLIAASETRHPRRDTAFALIAAGVLVTAVYCLLQLVIVGVLPNARATATPIASALEQVLGPGSATLGSLAVVVSVYGWLTGFTLMMPRVLFSMARHHELPEVLGLVHPRFHTPHVAIVTNAVLALVLGWYSSFALSATLAAIARLVVFAITCAALIALRKREGAPSGFRVPGGVLVASIGIGFSVWLLSTRNTTQLWLLGGFVAAGLLMQWLNRNRPHP